MNERDTSQTQKEQKISLETAHYAAVEIHSFDADDTTQKVYLSPDTVGFVTGIGELLGDDGQSVRDSEGRVVLVGEVTIFGQDGTSTTKRDRMDDILATDASIRAERQRQATVGKSMAGVAFKGEQSSFEPIAPPEVLPPHPDDEFRDAVPRSQVLAQDPERAAGSSQSDMIEVPREFVPRDSTAKKGVVDHTQRNIPVPEGSFVNRKTALGSPDNPTTPESQALNDYLNKTNQ